MTVPSSIIYDYYCVVVPILEEALTSNEQPTTTDEQNNEIPSPKEELVEEEPSNEPIDIETETNDTNSTDLKLHNSEPTTTTTRTTTSSNESTGLPERLETIESIEDANLSDIPEILRSIGINQSPAANLSHGVLPANLQLLLRQHVNQRNTNKHVGDQCPVCPFNVSAVNYLAGGAKSRAQLMQDHLLRHGKGVKSSQLICVVCLYETPHTHHFKRHMLQHSGYFPYECKGCEFKARRLENLKRHVEKNENCRQLCKLVHRRRRHNYPKPPARWPEPPDPDHSVRAQPASALDLRVSTVGGSTDSCSPGDSGTASDPARSDKSSPDSASASSALYAELIRAESCSPTDSSVSPDHRLSGKTAVKRPLPVAHHSAATATKRVSLSSPSNQVGQLLPTATSCLDPALQVRLRMLLNGRIRLNGAQQSADFSLDRWVPAPPPPAPLSSSSPSSSSSSSPPTAAVASNPTSALLNGVSTKLEEMIPELSCLD